MKTGWYVPHSAIAKDIRPEPNRRPGGGVGEDQLMETEREAVLLAISYLKSHIRSAEGCLRRQRARLDELGRESRE